MKIYKKSSYDYIVFLFFCVFTVHTSYGQNLNGDSALITPTGDKASQKVDRATEDKVFPSLCAPGEDSPARIIHFPYERWTDFNSQMKIAQEALNTVEGRFEEVHGFFADRIFGAENSNKSNEEQEEALSEIVEERAKRAFALIELIRKYPRAVVFHEFVTRIQNERVLPLLVSKTGTFQYTHIEDLPDVEHRSLNHLFQVSWARFPMGVPKKYADLDREQKHTLAVIGGAHILFFLGELPVIFPALSRADYQRVLDTSYLSLDYALEDKHKFYHETLFCHNDEICAVTNDGVRLLKTEYLSKTVNHFLNAFPFDQKPDDFQMLILAYDGGMNLQPYFSNYKVFRAADTCWE